MQPQRFRPDGRNAAPRISPATPESTIPAPRSADIDLPRDAVLNRRDRTTALVGSEAAADAGRRSAGGPIGPRIGLAGLDRPCALPGVQSSLLLLDGPDRPGGGRNRLRGSRQEGKGSAPGAAGNQRREAPRPGLLPL